MKKVYNYRNTKNINCIVAGTPLGFEISDHTEEINRKLHKLGENPTSNDSKYWVIDDNKDRGRYHLNISPDGKQLIFSVNGSGKSTKDVFNSHQWYYHIIDNVVITSSNTEYSHLFYSYSNMMKSHTGGSVLISVDIKQVNFKVDIENITSMEVTKKWWKNDIYIQLNFNKVLKNGTDTLTLQFDKSDERDADYIVDEINTIRRSIQSKEQMEILERLEKDD